MNSFLYCHSNLEEELPNSHKNRDEIPYGRAGKSLSRRSGAGPRPFLQSSSQVKKWKQSGQTLVLGLSKIITMRSLNAGKSSRLVVTVEPCLDTQHLHLWRNFQQFHGEKWRRVWGCLFKFTGNQPVYQFVGNGFKCYMKPDNLSLFQDFLKRTLADIPFCNRLQLGMSFMIASQVFSEF